MTEQRPRDKWDEWLEKQKEKRSVGPERRPCLDCNNAVSQGDYYVAILRRSGNASKTLGHIHYHCFKARYGDGPKPRDITNPLEKVTEK